MSQGPVIVEHGTHIEVTWPNGRGRVFDCTPELVEGWAEQINKLRGECTRLQAGVDHTPRPENAEGTPGQFLADLLSLDAEGRHDWVRRIREIGDAARRCFEMNHAAQAADAVQLRRVSGQMEAENSRLRAALEEIAHTVREPALTGTFQAIARQALAGDA